MGGQALGYGVGGSSRVGRFRGVALALVCLPLAAGQQACTTFAPHHPQPAPPAAARPQNLVIVPARSKPGIERASIDTVGRSAAGGAGKGLVAGVGAGLLMTLQVGVGSGGLGLLLLPVFVAAGAAVGTVGGTVVGAVQGAPERSQVVARRAAEQGLDPRYVQALLAASVLEAGKPLSRAALNVTANAEPIAIDTGTDYKTLAQMGRDYALETEVVQMGFEGTGGKQPWVAFFMVARARLVQLPSGKAVYERSFAYVRGYRQLSYWADENGRAAREEAVWAYADLGSRIAEEVYLHPLSGPVQVRDAGPGSAPQRRACELAPTELNASMSATTEESVQSAPATRSIEDSQPTLAWQSLSDATGLSGEDAGRLSQATEIRYDIRIWREASLGAGDLVYERIGLAETSHRVEEPLAPDATYDWSVRARFTLNGVPRSTRWSSLTAPDYSDLGAVLKRTYQSQPELMKRLAPNGFMSVDANGAHFSPCLLDFIPSANYFRFNVPGRSAAGGEVANTAAEAATVASLPAVRQGTPVSASVKSAASAAALTEPHLAMLSPGGVGAPEANPALPRLGDTWTYKLTDRGRLVDTLMVTVTALSAAQVTETLTRGASTTFHANRAYDANFDPARGLQETELPGRFFLAEFSPYAAPTLDDIGRQWDAVNSRLTAGLGTTPPEDWSFTVRIAGKDRVTVPAGVFECVKVEAVSKPRNGMYGSYTQRLEFWYAPTAKRTVKMVRRLDNSFSVYSYTDVYELAKYELH